MLPNVYDVRGIQVRCFHPLDGSYLQPLAATLGAYFRATGEKAAFQADLVKTSSGIFDPSMPTATAKQRLQRLLFRPIEVGGVVIKLEKQIARQMYQKTVRVIVASGALEQHDTGGVIHPKVDEAVAAAAASAGGVPLWQQFHTLVAAAPIRPYSGYAPMTVAREGAAPVAPQERDAAGLEQRRALEERLVALEKKFGEYFDERSRDELTPEELEREATANRLLAEGIKRQQDEQRREVEQVVRGYAHNFLLEFTAPVGLRFEERLAAFEKRANESVDAFNSVTVERWPEFDTFVAGLKAHDDLLSEILLRLKALEELKTLM